MLVIIIIFLVIVEKKQFHIIPKFAFYFRRTCWTLWTFHLQCNLIANFVFVFAFFFFFNKIIKQISFGLKGFPMLSFGLHVILPFLDNLDGTLTRFLVLCYVVLGLFLAICYVVFGLLTCHCSFVVFYSLTRPQKPEPWASRLQSLIGLWILVTSKYRVN